MSEYTAEIQRLGRDRIRKREKRSPNPSGTTPRPSYDGATFLGPRVLCEHRRYERRRDKGIHQESRKARR